MEKQSASVQRCIERLSRESIVKTESTSGQMFEFVKDIKAGTKEVQAITQRFEKDTAVSFARMEESLAKMILEWHVGIETVLQEGFRNRERKFHRSTDHSHSLRIGEVSDRN